MSSKEQLVASMMAGSGGTDAQEGTTKKKVLIEEIGAPSEGSKGSEEQTADVSPPTPQVLPVEDEGPSLMEQMMQAQQQAKRKDDEVKAKLRAKEDKKALGGGFKKGFFGGGGGAKPKKTAAKKVVKDKDDHIPTITAKNSGTAAGAGKGKKGVVLDDVQRALKEEEDRNPLLQQLKGGEWATDDLMGQLQSHPVLMRGLQNPRCQAALQLLQTDPSAAKKKFENDPEVAEFLQAFSGVMADHFTRLGQSQQQSGGAPSAGVQQTPPVIPEGQVEIGPLHAEAIARQKERQAGAEGVVSEVDREEDARVKEIVQDEELRNMLMDPQLQRVLQECNDPKEFQKHMRDPVTAYKIKKLFDAGLVGTAK